MEAFSHAAAIASLLPAMARAAVNIWADVMMVEVHSESDKVFSDGRQGLTSAAFVEMMRQVGR